MYWLILQKPSCGKNMKYQYVRCVLKYFALKLTHASSDKRSPVCFAVAVGR